MLSSFFSDASEARLVDRTARHVFSNPALVPFDDNFYDSYGASQFIDHLFAKLQGNGEKSSDDREVGMGMLATALENETRVAAEVLKDGRLKSFLERIPYIVDSISEQEEADQLLRVWTLLLYRDAAIGTNLSKVIPRLMGKLSGYISASVSSGIDERDRVKEPLCIAMLSAVAGCQYQNTLMPHADSLVASCLMLRDWDEEEGLQSLFALVMSLESPLTWQGVWSLLTDSACDLCRNHLGIPVTPRPVSQSAKKTNDADDSTHKSRGSGVGVYKTVENALQVTLERLSQAMRRGDTAHFAGMVFDATEEVVPKGKPSSKSKQSKGKGGHQNGCVGAIAAETVYRRLLGTLRAMLEVGCATGAIQLDLLALLPLHRAVLGINSVSSAHKSGNGGVDPKALLLPGASGLSPADLMLVAPAMKVRTLQLIQSLLALRSPALLKAGAELSEPVAHLFVDVETHRHPLVGEAVTFTIASIAESFPTILARHLSGAMEVLAGLYAAEVEHLTREPSIAVAAQPVSASSAKAKKSSDAAPSPSDATLPFSAGALHTAEVASSGPSSSLSTTRAGELAMAITPGLYRSDGLTGMRSHSATAPGALAVFTAVETVLLYCAAFLSEKLQDRFEYFTGQALHCLTKGLMACTVPNKAVKRARVAPLRMSADLQRAVLRIARADLAYPRSTGMRSGNAALLLAVCEATKHQTGTAAESVTCQVLLEALLNPTSAPLSSPNYDDIAARKARRALEQQEEEEQLARAHADQLRRAARKRDAAEESAPSGSEGPEGPEGRGGSTKRARGADNRSKGEPDEPEEGDKGEDEEEDEEDEDDEDDEDDDGDEQEKRQESAERLALRNDDDDDDFELPEIV